MESEEGVIKRRWDGSGWVINYEEEMRREK